MAVYTRSITEYHGETLPPHPEHCVIAML